jgi:hypothetical protein
MRNRMMITVAAVVIATGGLVAAGVPAGAQGLPTPHATGKGHGTLKGTFYLHQTERQAIDIGATGTSVGDVVTGSGTVSTSRGGAAIGSFAYRAETLTVAIPGGTESRNSILWVTLDGGRIAATSLISVQAGARPVATQEYVVLGGTGTYARVRGTMTFTPVSADDYTVTFRISR